MKCDTLFLMRLLFVLITGICNKVAAQDSIVRKPLLTAGPIDKLVKTAEIKEIVFKPLQKTPLHLHPCPVVGYIAEGCVWFKLRGSDKKLLKAGDAFFEPAGVTVESFDNASDKLPLKFIAFYLVNEEKSLIQLLPAK